MSTSRAGWPPVGARPAYSNTATDSRSMVPCKFFISGNCRNGSSCPFYHAENSTPQSCQAPQDMSEQDEAETEDFSRTIAGAYVRFEDGGRVSTICLPNDFSAVHLSGLPRGSSPRVVQNILAEYGFYIPEENIWIRCQDGLLSANVRAEDPAFSKKLCMHLQASRQASGIHATPVAARMPSGHTLGRVDCKKVHVSWHKAVRTVWLNFGSGGIAGRVSRKFTTGVYTILGQRVLAGTPSRASAPTSRLYNPATWTVRLTDVPASASRSAISRAISLQADTPHHIELAAPGYSVDDEQAAAMVRSLLTEIGPLDYWEETLESTAKRVKATARFLDETDARDATSRLNGMVLPFHKNGKLTVQMVYSAKFKARSDIYAAVVSRASAHVDAWKAKHVLFRAYPSSWILKVEGESDAEVANAKAVLDSILSGVVAKDGQASLWDPSLRGNGQLWRSIKQRQQSLGVTVIRDKAKQELRLFGTEKRCNEAQRQLASLFRMEASSTHVIELDAPTFSWACLGGFKAIIGRLGTEKAALDVVSSPKKIVISGSLEDYDMALALANRRELEDLLETFEKLSIADDAEDCSVCWTEADAPVRMACDHVYCQDCFENGCAALSGSGTDFALLCHGDQGNCNRPISLQDLHKYLSSAVFEAFLEKSLASYVRRHPDELRFCPTPDCGYVYRATESAKTHTCANCLQRTCSTCHEPHVDMTCAEYKDMRSGGYVAFEKAKKEMGIKDCPRCKIPIEKVAGCNHMTCLGCNAHICWVCLKTFPSDGPVYRHMSEMHGGHIAWDER